MAGKQVKRGGIESVRAELAARDVESFRLDALASFDSYTAGDPFAQAVVVLGQPQPQDESLLDNASVIALSKALVAMGYRKRSLFVISLDNGTETAGELQKRMGALRPLIELVDPICVVAADAVATDAVRAAFGMSREAVGFERVLGRSIVLFDDFRAALDDDKKKREAWHQLRQLALL